MRLLIAATIVIALAACQPVPMPMPGPPPVITVPPPMALPMPVPQIMEPIPPPRQRRGVVKSRYGVLGPKCPVGSQWVTSHRVLVAGTNKSRVVQGRCVKRI